MWLNSKVLKMFLNWAPRGRKYYARSADYESRVLSVRLNSCRECFFLAESQSFYFWGLHPVALITTILKGAVNRNWMFSSISFTTTCFGPYGPLGDTSSIHSTWRWPVGAETSSGEWNRRKHSVAIDGTFKNCRITRDPPHWPCDTPLSAKVGTNFTDKRRSLGRYSSLVDSSHGVS
jgi:hypothetical protein